MCITYYYIGGSVKLFEKDCWYIMLYINTTEDELGSFGSAHTSSKGTIVIAFAVSKVVMVALIATSGTAMMVKVNVTCRPAESHAFTHHYILCVCVCVCARASGRWVMGLLSVSGQIRKWWWGGGGGGGGEGAVFSGRRKGTLHESRHCNP